MERIREQKGASEGRRERRERYAACCGCVVYFARESQNGRPPTSLDLASLPLLPPPTTPPPSHHSRSLLNLDRIILINIRATSQVATQQLHPGTCSYVASYRFLFSVICTSLHPSGAYASAAQGHCASSHDSYRVARLYIARISFYISFPSLVTKLSLHSHTESPLLPCTRRHINTYQPTFSHPTNDRIVPSHSNLQ